LKLNQLTQSKETEYLNFIWFLKEYIKSDFRERLYVPCPRNICRVYLLEMLLGYLLHCTDSNACTLQADLTHCFWCPDPSGSEVPRSRYSGTGKRKGNQKEWVVSKTFFYEALFPKYLPAVGRESEMQGNGPRKLFVAGIL